MSDIYDITIIGGGPTGMFAAFYAGMRQVSTKIIEAMPVLGGQINLLYPDKTIYDIGGHAGITGRELTEQLTQQMNHFHPTICLREHVTHLTKKDGIFCIKTNTTTHYSRTVIITTGQGSFKPRRLPFNYPKIFEQTNLHYIVHPLESYRQKDVVICGGGDSAVDWALTLEKIANQVTLVHRRHHFRAHEATVRQLEESSVRILTPYVPTQLYSANQQTVDHILLTKKRTDQSLAITADYFIINYGFISSMDAIEQWGVTLNDRGICVSPTMHTNIPGIFAAGDAAHYDGKIKLIAVGFGEAPTAVNHAVQYLDPSRKKQPVQSTTLDLTP